MAYIKNGVNCPLLFIHVPKTGGTSIEKHMFARKDEIFAIRKIIGDDKSYIDSITCQMPFIKSNILLDIKSQKLFKRWGTLHLTLSDYENVFLNKKLPVKIPEKYKTVKLKQQLNAQDNWVPINNHSPKHLHFRGNFYKIEQVLGVCEDLNLNELSATFKFSCIRNPKTRLVSHWLKHSPVRMGVEYIERNNRKNIASFNKWMQEFYPKIMKDRFIPYQKTKDGKVIYRDLTLHPDMYHYFLFDNLKNKNINTDHLIDFDQINTEFRGALPFLNRGNVASEGASKEEFYLSFYSKESLSVFENFNRRDLDFYEKFKSKYKPRKITRAITNFMEERK